jgi:hypothetical protein
MAQPAAPRRIPRLAIAVTAHFVPDRLVYLHTIATQFPVLADQVEVFIVTNATSTEQAAIDAALGDIDIDYRFVTPTKLGHPFLLAWSHLWVFRELRRLPEAERPTHFLYVEDDILVRPQHIAYWLRGREELRPNGLIPSWLRYEFDGSGVAYSSDVTAPAQYAKLPKVVRDGGYAYLNLRFPYQGAYLMDRELLNEHLDGRSSSPDFGPWRSRESAAQGLTFAGVPAGFTSRNLIGYRTDEGTIDPDCLIHHLPNSYVGMPNTPFGKLTISDVVQHARPHRLSCRPPRNSRAAVHAWPRGCGDSRRGSTRRWRAKAEPDCRHLPEYAVQTHGSMPRHTARSTMVCSWRRR